MFTYFTYKLSSALGPLLPDDSPNVELRRPWPSVGGQQPGPLTTDAGAG